MTFSKNIVVHEPFSTIVTSVLSSIIIIKTPSDDILKSSYNSTGAYR